MISVNINCLEEKFFPKAFSISYCFSKRGGGVLVTADLRVSCQFDTFLKGIFIHAMSLTFPVPHQYVVSPM
jgi:hypothetical protein